MAAGAGKWPPMVGIATAAWIVVAVVSWMGMGAVVGLVLGCAGRPGRQSADRHRLAARLAAALLRAERGRPLADTVMTVNFHSSRFVFSQVSETIFFENSPRETDALRNFPSTRNFPLGRRFEQRPYLKGYFGFSDRGSGWKNARIPVVPRGRAGSRKICEQPVAIRRSSVLEMRSIQSWCQRASLRTGPFPRPPLPWVHP